MKNTLKKILNVVVTLAILLLALVCIGLYLAGIWRIKLSNGWKLSFDALGGMSVFAVFGAMIGREKVDKILSVHDAKLEYKACKKFRRKLRLLFCVIWFAAYGAIYALGQANGWHEAYQHLGSLSLLNLGIVYLYGIMGSSIIPVPDPPESLE